MQRKDENQPQILHNTDNSHVDLLEIGVKQAAHFYWIYSVNIHVGFILFTHCQYIGIYVITSIISCP